MFDYYKFIHTSPLLPCLPILQLHLLVLHAEAVQQAVQLISMLVVDIREVMAEVTHCHKMLKDKYSPNCLTKLDQLKC